MITYQKRNGIQSRARDIKEQKSQRKICIYSLQQCNEPHKSPFLVFSKLKDPTTLTNIDNLSSPVCYWSQKSACQDSKLLSEGFHFFSPWIYTLNLLEKYLISIHKEELMALFFSTSVVLECLVKLSKEKIFVIFWGGSSTSTLDSLLKNHLKLAISWVMFIMQHQNRINFLVHLYYYSFKKLI